MREHEDDQVKWYGSVFDILMFFNDEKYEWW